MRRLVLVLMLWWPLAVAAANFNAGLAAYKRGDYDAALREWKPLAERGDASAQYYLGWIYLGGKGVPEDYAEAERWWRKATAQYSRRARQGDASAQYHLGQIYRYGTGVAADLAQAAQWFRKAADQGQVAAQLNLGDMYHKGEGVLQDFTEAAKWYQKAAEQGHVDAQLQLARMYSSGQGFPQADVIAYAWFNVAAAQGNAAAASDRGIILERMTSEQVAEAQKLSRTIATRISRAPASPTPVGPSRETVRALQRRLAELGYDPGAADGLIGRRTKAAIRQAQNDLELTQTGQATEELLRLLQTVNPRR